MSLTPQDLKAIESIVNTVVKHNNLLLLQEMDDRDRIMLDMTRQQSQAMEQRISENIAEIVHDAIAPKIDNHDTRITKLESMISSV